MSPTLAPAPENREAADADRAEEVVVEETPDEAERDVEAEVDAAAAADLEDVREDHGGDDDLSEPVESGETPADRATDYTEDAAGTEIDPAAAAFTEADLDDSPEDRGVDHDLSEPVEPDETPADRATDYTEDAAGTEIDPAAAAFTDADLDDSPEDHSADHDLSEPVEPDETPADRATDYTEDAAGTEIDPAAAAFTEADLDDSPEDHGVDDDLTEQDEPARTAPDGGTGPDDVGAADAEIDPAAAADPDLDLEASPADEDEADPDDQSDVSETGDEEADQPWAEGDPDSHAAATAVTAALQAPDESDRAEPADAWGTDPDADFTPVDVAPAAVAEPVPVGASAAPVEYHAAHSRRGFTLVAGAVAAVAGVIAILLALRGDLVSPGGLSSAAVALVSVLLVVQLGALKRVVTLRDGTLDVVQGDARHRFDLTTEKTQIQMMGQPGDKDWQMLLARRGLSPVAIGPSEVDPEPFVEAVRQWRHDV